MTSVKVKRLKWTDKTYSSFAECPFGRFLIRESNNADGEWGWVVFQPNGTNRSVGSIVSPRITRLVSAKAACQAYFERLVLECLEADNETN